MTSYNTLPWVDVSAIRRRQSIAIRPPVRQTVTETLQQSVYVRGPGGVYELWRPDLTPYMVEPADDMTDRRVDWQAFMGPARTGKTLIIDGLIAHAISVDPSDFCLVHMTESKGRQYSITRLARMLRHSPDIRAGLSPVPRHNNVFDRFGAAGQIIKISWPSITELSGSDYRWIAATDVDRFPDSIGGEGDIFGIAGKRVETYLSSAGQYYESSPSPDKGLTDPQWRPAHPHQAPPVSGIAGAYNRGDQRMWYWRCLHCQAPMRVSADLALFGVPTFEELSEIISRADIEALVAEHNQVACRECGAIHSPRDRRALNATGRWVPRGQALQPDGTLTGPPPVGTARTRWLGGAAAAYQSWAKMLRAYFLAVRHYTETGDEELLRRTITQDQGGVYRSPALKANRIGADQLRERLEARTERTVPTEARALVATVDVQSDRFQVQVMAYGVHRERWLVDYYALRRPDSPDRATVDPAAYAEDWDLITKLITKTYPIDGDPEQRMSILIVGCDSGGAEGVTDNAYAYWRKLRRDAPELSRKFLLVKGDPRLSAPRQKLTYPDTSKVKARGASRGDVPVLQINVNRIKDTIAGDLARTEPGPGYLHLPAHIGDWWMRGYTRETRDSKGRWGTGGQKGNEPLDLDVYAGALLEHLGYAAVNWNRPPPTFAPIPGNASVTGPDGRAGPTAQPRPVRRSMVAGRVR